MRTLDGLIDTKALGKMAPLVVGLLTGLSEVERSLIQERSRESVEHRRKTGGNLGGRPKTSNKKESLVLRLRKEGESYRSIKDQTGLALATIAAVPVAAEVDPIEIESFAVQQAPIKQVYLLLITQSNVRGVKSSAHSTFPMPDINQCEKEGERWKSTAIDGINDNDKSYYCVKGSK